MTKSPAPLKVSIRAPVKGATVDGASIPSAHSVSIRAPVKGATYFAGIHD